MRISLTRWFYCLTLAFCLSSRPQLSGQTANPDFLTSIGFCDTIGRAYGVAIMGNYACVADGLGGLQVIDVTNPAKPVRVGGYGVVNFGSALAVTMAGNYAYVADSFEGMQVFDLSNPAYPALIGAYKSILPVNLCALVALEPNRP